MVQGIVGPWRDIVGLVCFLFNLNRNSKAQKVPKEETGRIRVLERSLGLPARRTGRWLDFCPPKKIPFIPGPDILFSQNSM